MSINMLVTSALILHQSVIPFACAQEAMMAEPSNTISATEPTGEHIELLVGDIFEIIPSHTIPDPTYTWILTQDRNFIEAGRARVFRKRIIQPGTYTLYAEVSSEAQGIHLSSTFIVEYKARQPGQITTMQPTSPDGSIIVTTVPALSQNGNVVLTQGAGLLKLIPVQPNLKPLALDMNIEVDANGDGNASNDIENELTFFQSDATPLFIWFTTPSASQTLAVTAVRSDGAQVQEIDVLQQQYAQDQGMTDSKIGVNVEKTGNLTYAFSAELDDSISAETPVLYNWEFGDGQQSLLKNPTHEYAEEGTYDVRLLIRNLTNGNEIATYEEELEVDMDVESVSSNPSSTSSEEMTTEPNNTPDAQSSISWGTIFLLGGIFLGSVLIGLFVIFLIAKLRKRGTTLSSTLEKMEESIVKKDETKSPSTLTIAPVPTPSTPPAAVAEREKERTAPTPPSSKIEPKIEEKNAPAWLKSGLVNAPATATPAPVTPPKSVTPPPTPAPLTPPTPKLQKPVPTPAPAAPKPTAPAALATPTPAPTPAVPPAPKPLVAENTPAWLKPRPTPAVPVKQSTPAPSATIPTTPAPVMTPQKPVTPPAAPTPAPTPLVPPPAPKPMTVPAPVTPTPAATPASIPVVATTPVVPTPPPALKPQTPPQAPVAPPKPQPVPPPAPKPQETSGDEPVAFIRADSLDQPSSTTKTEGRKDDTQA